MKTFFYYYILLIAVLSAGCSTAKKSSTEQQNTDLQTVRHTAASDSSILDYNVDTSKYCAQALDFERVEYYNETYTDSTGHVRQMVKAVTRKKAGRVAAQKGTTEAKAVEVVKDSTREAVRVHETVKTATTERKRDTGALWAIIVALLLTAGLYWYMKNK